MNTTSFLQNWNGPPAPADRAGSGLPLPPRLLLIFYAMTLLLAMPATWSLFTTLNNEADASLAPLQLLDGFNYTVFSDFWHESGNAITPLLRVGWLTALVSWLIWTWAAGGILHSFQAPIRPETFWQAGTHYMARYVRLWFVAGLFTLAVFLVPFVIGILLAILFDDALTERGLTGLVAGGLLVGTLGTLLVLCIADYARAFMFRHDERGAFRAFGQAGRFVLGNLRITLGRYLLLSALTLGLLGLYLLLDALLPMRNWLLIGLMILVQQAIVLGRLVLNVQRLRVAYHVSKQYDAPMADTGKRDADLSME